MKLKTQLNHVIPPLEFIERGDSSLIDLVSTERGIEVRSFAGGSVEITGEIEEDDAAHGTITKGMLRLFRNAVSEWPVEVRQGHWTVIELGDHRLSAFPLNYPMFLISVPLSRALEFSEGDNARSNTVNVNSGTKLDVFRDLIRQPSRRDPDEAVTRIEIEPYVFSMYSFDGHILAHHRMHVKSDGAIESDVSNASLKYALSTELRGLGKLEVGHRGDALSLSKEGLEVIVDGAHSSTFEPALQRFECEVKHSEFDVKKERLLDLCQGAIKAGFQFIEIIPHEGIARIVDTSQMQARGYQLPSEVEQKKVGLSVQVIDRPPWGEIDSLILKAEDLAFPLKMLKEDEHVTLTVVGERGPDYTIVHGDEDCLRFGIRPHTRIGG